MLNGMNLKTLSVAMAVAIAIAAVGAVGVLTSMSFIQDAEAKACIVNLKKGDAVKCPFPTPEGPDDNIHFHHD